jgi:hypothetical protein
MRAQPQEILSRKSEAQNFIELAGPPKFSSDSLTANLMNAVASCPSALWLRHTLDLNYPTGRWARAIKID